MGTWSRLSGIPFNQLQDEKVTEKGLFAALREFRAIDLLRAVEHGMHQHRSVSRRGEPNKGKRWRLNQDRRQLDAILAHVGALGGNALGQPPPPMQPLAGSAVGPVPFHTALSTSSRRCANHSRS